MIVVPKRCPWDINGVLSVLALRNVTREREVRQRVLEMLKIGMIRNTLTWGMHFGWLEKKIQKFLLWKIL